MVHNGTNIVRHDNAMVHDATNMAFDGTNAVPNVIDVVRIVPKRSIMVSTWYIVTIQ